MFGIPRLEPRPDALLQLRDNLIGDAFIDIVFHCKFSMVSGLRMQPTSHAAMSGGSAVRAGKRRVVRAGSEADYTAADFRPIGLGLDGQGAAGPVIKGMKVSRRLSLEIRARDRHLMAETRSGSVSASE
jgi:hypothetical protein